MFASLPMYDFPSVKGATDRYWQAIRTALGHGPRHLSRGGSLWDHWQRPDLILSQSCSLPYRAGLRGKVQLVGAPDYGLPACGAGEYNSVFVVRSDDARDTLAAFHGACFGVNSFNSQSGWAAPDAYAQSRDVWFGSYLPTGSHLASAQAVADGQADIAALDALSWRFIQTDASFEGDLKVIDATPGSPATPYITSMSEDPNPIFEAIEQAIAALTPDDRHALSLKGVMRVTEKAYCAVPTPDVPNPARVIANRADAGSFAGSGANSST